MVNSISKIYSLWDGLKAKKKYSDYYHTLYAKLIGEWPLEFSKYDGFYQEIHQDSKDRELYGIGSLTTIQSDYSIKIFVHNYAFEYDPKVVFNFIVMVNMIHQTFPSYMPAKWGS